MKPIKVGLIGLGKFGELESEILFNMDSVILDAFSSRSSKRLEEFGERFSVNKLYTDYEELVSEKELDAVFITSSSENHAMQAKYALENNKNVFVEKPLALSYEEGKSIVKIAEKKELLLMVGFLSRFDHKLRMLKECINNGSFGSLAYLSFHRSCSKSLLENSNYLDPVQETMIHDIDLALWLSQSNVNKVNAINISSVNCNKKSSAYLATLSFENGMGAVFETDWLIPNSAPVNSLKGERTVDAHLKVIGDKARAKINFINNGLTIWGKNKIINPLTGLNDVIGERIRGALYDQLYHFVECINNKTESTIASSQDALYGLKIVEKILNSAETGREILL